MARIETFISMDDSLGGKVAMITGAASDIRGAIAFRLGKAGADVVVNDTNFEQADKVVNEIGILEHKAMAIKADVPNSVEVRRKVHAGVNYFGEIAS